MKSDGMLDLLYPVSQTTTKKRSKPPCSNVECWNSRNSSSYLLLPTTNVQECPCFLVVSTFEIKVKLFMYLMCVTASYGLCAFPINRVTGLASLISFISVVVVVFGPRGNSLLMFMD